MTPTARTTEEWEAQVGAHVRELRLRRNVTQAALAAEANVGLSALRALEQGRGSSLSTVIRVVRALGREAWLDELAPPATISPMAMLEASRRDQRRRRRRASPERGPR